MSDRRYRPRPAGLIAYALATLVMGCAPGYVLRAAYEEAKILWRREPIATVLARDDLDPASRRKLELVRAAREFARRVGLDVGGSFSSLSYVDARQTVWVVTAAPRTSLAPYTWWFPIVGSIPYKGFFDRGRADREAAALEARGYDTYVRSAAAFSTLGWFDDPVLRHWLKGDEVFLVDLVLHELYHRTFFLKGARASTFNESVANFVGHRGAIAFFAERSEDVALGRRAEERWEDELRFARFAGQLVERLEALYAGADEAAVLAARADVFAAARTELAALRLREPRVKDVATAPLNNAVVIQYRLYDTDLDLLEAVWRRAGGLRRALDFIERAAARRPDAPFSAVRAALAEETHAAPALGAGVPAPEETRALSPRP
jgi:predicted aminopeptidase